MILTSIEVVYYKPYYQKRHKYSFNTIDSLVPCGTIDFIFRYQVILICLHGAKLLYTTIYDLQVSNMFTAETLWLVCLSIFIGSYLLALPSLTTLNNINTGCSINCS